MFEERNITIKAYNLNTILAEKIESILVRNVSNTRGRDFYDVYIILTLRKQNIKLMELKEAIWEKAKERNSEVYIENYKKYLKDICQSNYLVEIWDSYKEKYSYAKDIEFIKIINVIRSVLE